MLSTILFYLLLTLTASISICLGEFCNKGIITTNLADTAFNSSSYRAPEYSAKYARFRPDETFQAWCPLSDVDETLSEFLQIDLDAQYHVLEVHTLGLKKDSIYTSNLVIDYKREANGPWIRHVNPLNSCIYSANKHATVEGIIKLTPPVTARWIRFYPYSHQPTRACLNVKLIGCPANGLVEYSTVAPIMMPDSSYDLQNNRFSSVLVYPSRTSTNICPVRLRPDQFLVGGLGKLYDSEITDPKSAELIVWNPKDSDHDRIRIAFRFDQFYNFSLVSVHNIPLRQPLNLINGTRLLITGPNEIKASLYRIPQVDILKVLQDPQTISELPQKFPIVAQAFETKSLSEWIDLRFESDLSLEYIGDKRQFARIGNLIILDLKLEHKSDWLALDEVYFQNFKPTLIQYQEMLDKLMTKDSILVEKKHIMTTQTLSNYDPKEDINKDGNISVDDQFSEEDTTEVPSEEFAKYATVVVISLLCALVAIFVISATFIMWRRRRKLLEKQGSPGSHRGNHHKTPADLKYLPKLALRHSRASLVENPNLLSNGGGSSSDGSTQHTTIPVNGNPSLFSPTYQSHITPMDHATISALAATYLQNSVINSNHNMYPGLTTPATMARSVVLGLQSSQYFMPNGGPMIDPSELSAMQLSPLGAPHNNCFLPISSNQNIQKGDYSGVQSVYTTLPDQIGSDSDSESVSNEPSVNTPLVIPPPPKIPLPPTPNGTLGYNNSKSMLKMQQQAVPQFNQAHNKQWFQNPDSQSYVNGTSALIQHQQHQLMMLGLLNNAGLANCTSMGSNNNLNGLINANHTNKARSRVSIPDVTSNGR